MKKWFIVLVCAPTFLFAHNTFAAIKFKRFAHCGEGFVTVDCECHTSYSGVWHYSAPDTTAIRQMAVAENSLARNHFR